MKAPLIFCSTSHAINVQKIFKVCTVCIPFYSLCIRADSVSPPADYLVQGF